MEGGKEAKAEVVMVGVVMVEEKAVAEAMVAGVVAVAEMEVEEAQGRLVCT